MALPDLLQALEEEAEAELAAAERAAREQADALRRAAREDAERLLSEAVESAEAQARATAAQRVAAARAQAAREVREAREVALQDLLQAAREALEGVRSGPRGEAVLAGSLREAFVHVPAATTVSVDPRDEHRVRGLLDGHRDAIVVPDLTTAGGVVVRGSGRYADSTLETRLAGAWPALRATVTAGWEGPS